MEQLPSSSFQKSKSHNMMKAIIVEDEKNSRELLRSAIENFTDGVEVIGEADNVNNAVALINKLKPDVLFLDIELPDGKGFDIIDRLDENYKVIFVTAYDDYAIKAIRYAAIDYLVKPLDLDDLEASIERLKIRPSITQKNIDLLNNKLKSSTAHEDKIMIASHKSYKLLNMDDIVAVEADENYVFFILENGKKHLASQSLNYFESLLPSEKFYRIHKSHIINLTKVKSVEKGRTGKAIFHNGSTMDIAARRKSAFLTYLKKYTEQ